MSAQAELGPNLPSRASISVLARELEARAKRAVEFAGSGPTADYPVALDLLAQMRALLGEPGLRVAPGDPLPSPQDVADASCEVTPSLARAVRRLQAFADSQHLPAGPGDLGPPLYFSDVRAVLCAIAGG